MTKGLPHTRCARKKVWIRWGKNIHNVTIFGKRIQLKLLSVSAEKLSKNMLRKTLKTWNYSLIYLPLICGIFCGFCSDYLSWSTENSNPAIHKRLSQASLNEPGVKVLKSCGYFYHSFLLLIAMRHRATEGKHRVNAKLKTIECASLSEHAGSIHVCHLQIQNERTEMAELTFP